MTHHASPDFWACYRALPAAVRELADQAYEHLKQDPRYPSRPAVEAPDGLVWFWIGTHADYDKLVG